MFHLRENAETMALLDAVLGGLTDPEAGALLSLCAGLVAEFLSWSIKHLPPEQGGGGGKGGGVGVLNASSLLRRLYTLLEHPDAHKRLGAAVALEQVFLNP
jgi:hypothetical protein